MAATIETTIRHETLRWAVGREIFCKACKHILDARKAVLITLEGHGSAVTCTDCAKRVNLDEAVAAGATVEAWDWVSGTE